jgi:hypothetical protein
MIDADCVALYLLTYHAEFLILPLPVVERDGWISGKRYLAILFDGYVECYRFYLDWR